MPSTTEIAQQFDTIEDTIAAFSKILLLAGHIQIVFNMISRLARLLNDFLMTSVTDNDSPPENGEFIIVLDSQDRENEGDLIIAAESITAAQMAFLVRYTR